MGFTWNSSYKWLTCDVRFLYSWMPHDLGLQAFQYHLDLYTELSSNLKWLILEGVSFLLEHNYFLFDKKLYIQKREASMGSKFAPTYATLHMGWWEEKSVYRINNPYRYQIAYFYCYIDDLIFAVKKDLLLDGFFYLNNNPLNLSFTGEKRVSKINNLNLTLAGSNYSHTVMICSYR